MAKRRASYLCEACGSHHGQWAGRCEACGEWNSIVESRDPAPRRAGATTASAIELTQFDGEPGRRRSTGISELDRVLGGGLVPGSLVLLGGDPGIGKSTLVLDVAARLAASSNPCLYFAAEESPAQIHMRAQRLGLDGKALFIYPRHRHRWRSRRGRAPAIGTHRRRLHPDSPRGHPRLGARHREPGARGHLAPARFR